MSHDEGRQRVVIEKVSPVIDGGRFPVKRIAGDRVAVEADAFADGHDVVACALEHRRAVDPDWCGDPMEPLGNDRWRGEFPVEEVGEYRFRVRAWIDRLATGCRDLAKKVEAGTAEPADFKIVEALERRPAVDRPTETPEFRVTVDREKARFSAWYELFPRSAKEPGRHGTFRDCEALLPYVAGMGFDVLYFPPIHPIGKAYRKGPNNSPAAKPGDPGSPWGIGSKEGGHAAIHPELGTLDDFKRLMAKAREQGLELALDLAYQCSPDHPWVREHPEWFRKRPDGTIQYAENPPKKYQDIYPLDFETEAWRELWEALKGIVLFWAGQGVRIFRVDNPHTKPFAFWEWMIGEVKREHPDAIFLAEAFTRPKVMVRLAKLGFTQSYTYFTWRNTKPELTEYFTELTQTEVKEFFRPNLWPNTPDILHAYLQTGGAPAFRVRLVLAATLGASYGIYGPAFELCEREPLEPGSEEYRNSEKYEIRRWDRARPDSLQGLIAKVNRIRAENRALQSDDSLRFHATVNPELLCYSKRDAETGNAILAVVNLDPRNPQSGWVELDGPSLGIDGETLYRVQDLLNGPSYDWKGLRNYVVLDPKETPAHLFRIEATA